MVQILITRGVCNMKKEVFNSFFRGCVRFPPRFMPLSAQKKAFETANQISFFLFFFVNSQSDSEIFKAEKSFFLFRIKQQHKKQIAIAGFS